MRPGSSGRGRPADVNPPEADLGGVEAIEPQKAEDACSDRTGPHEHSRRSRKDPFRILRYMYLVRPPTAVTGLSMVPLACLKDPHPPAARRP